MQEIADNFAVVPRNCVAPTYVNYIVVQTRKVDCENGYIKMASNIKNW